LRGEDAGLAASSLGAVELKVDVVLFDDFSRYKSALFEQRLCDSLRPAFQLHTALVALRKHFVPRTLTRELESVDSSIGARHA